MLLRFTRVRVRDALLAISLALAMTWGVPPVMAEPDDDGLTAEDLAMMSESPHVDAPAPTGNTGLDTLPPRLGNAQGMAVIPRASTRSGSRLVMATAVTGRAAPASAEPTRSAAANVVAPPLPMGAPAPGDAHATADKKAGGGPGAVPARAVATGVGATSVAVAAPTRPAVSGKAPDAKSKSVVSARPASAVAPAAPGTGATGPAGTKPRIDEVALVGGSAEADRVDADASYYGQTGGSYQVQKGDTLGKVAARVLGSSKRWREIARANPNVDPNRLVPGQTLIIPGMPGAAASLSSAPSPAYGGMEGYPQMMTAPPLSAGDPGMAGGYGAGPMPAVTAPPLGAYQGAGASNQPPPLPMMTDQGRGMAGNSYDSAVGGPPPLPAYPQAYPGGPALGMTPPPPIPEPPMMSAENPAGMAMAPPPPVSVGPGPMVATPLYQETRYRLPEELKPTDITPYFANANGMHGVFNTECALYPYDSTWHLGFHYKWENVRYLWGDKDVMDGSRWLARVNLLYTGHRFMAGVTIPWQGWQVGPRNSILGDDDYSSLHDPEVRCGYQIWKNYDGTHAVTLHVSARFSSDNHDWPNPAFTGHGQTLNIGPAYATRGHWVEFGGAYTGILNDRWTSHLNLALANDSEDDLTRIIYGGTLDYRVNHNFSLVSELHGTYWRTGTDFALLPPLTAAQRRALNLPTQLFTMTAHDGANTDLLLGCTIFNDHWQFVLGFPMALTSNWGVGHDFGVVTGVNARW